MSDLKAPRKVQVTPKLATQWLKTNIDNRKLSEAHVRKLARDMSNDDFPNLGETLKFDTEGHLIDGQHRLEAVKLSGKTVEFFVVEGIPREHRYRMDKVRPRKVSDQLTMQHRIPSAQMAAASVRIILMWQIEVIKSETFKPTDSEIIDFTVQNADLINQAVRYGMQLRSEIGALPSATAALYFLTYQIDAAEALNFWEALKTGEGLHKGGEKNPKSFMAMVAKAWNARREGKKMLALSPKASAELTDDNFKLA